MYYKIYKINNNDDYNDIHILRFSHNPFYDSSTEEIEENDKKIKELLDLLIEQAHNNHLCYNSVYPWQDIKELFDINNEIIIAYNYKTNQIQGWCNLNYSSFNINNNNGDDVFDVEFNVSKKSNMVYTCYIDKLVTRSKPKIKYIGLLLLEFVRDITITEPENKQKFIKFIETDPRNTNTGKYNDIIIDVIYLYSLTTSIGFYKKTFLSQLFKYDTTDKQNTILNHVFRYIRNDKLHRPPSSFKKQLNSFYDMHIMDCKTLMSEIDIQKYTDFNAPDDCKNNNPEISYNIFSDDFIDYNVNRTCGIRSSRSITSKSKSKSIIKK